MREIKFRAWDKTGKYKVMCSVLNIYSGDNPFVQCACDWQDGPVYRWRVFTRCINDIEVMQYTGLKDKNGKEIYEGDLICHLTKHLDGEQTKSLPYVVEFKNGSFQLVYKPNRDYNTLGAQLLENWEVIGNIYENPELLNEKGRG